MNKLMDSKTLFLLDAYALIYRSYYAFLKNPRINSQGLNTSAIMGFVNTLEEILQKENPTHIAVAFDPPGGTFRHVAFAAYKAQREETPEVIRQSIPIIKRIIEAYRIPILEIAGFEADDVIGTIAKKAAQNGYTTYMMTPDKDYCQLVDEHTFIYKPKFGGGIEILGIQEVLDKFEIIRPDQVIDILGLMGDASDNIPGCPGVGEKRAIRLVQDFDSVENLLAHTDKIPGALRLKVEENVEQIKFSKFLATIKIDVPISFDEKALIRESKDETALLAIFQELEFRNLIDRIIGKNRTVAPTPSKTTPIQGSLFDLFDAPLPEKIVETNLSELKSTENRYKLIENEEDIAELLQKLNAAKIISFDTETTGVDPISAHLVGISFSVQAQEAFYVPIPEEKSEALKIVRNFKSVLENPSTLKVGQNIKYDYIILSHYDISVGGNFFDTMIAHYLLQPEQPHNMDYLAEIYLSYQTIKIDELIGKRGKDQLSMRDISPIEIVNYACEDADVTLQLFEKFQPLITQEGFQFLFEEIEMPLVRVLAEMELSGVRIDEVALKESSVLFTQRINEIEQDIYALAGRSFNIASPKQVGEILFDHLALDAKAKKTKTGQYITNEEVLEKLRPKHEIVGKILDLRGLRKLLSTYVDALTLLVDKNTGKIHTSFNQAVTATGRLSSSNPNLQNIPIRDVDGKLIRAAFVPDNGAKFLSADYSQIELRIMAHLSNDVNMIAAFRSGEDIHAATAARIYKVPLSEVTSDMRRKAKTANFGIIYGISVFGLSERLNISRGEAKELIDGYFELYPQVKTYMEKSIEIAREKGYVETLTGRRRTLPDINSRNSVVRGFSERNAINAPIQGGAADIIKIAMIRIARRIEQEKLSSRMILQVHDELNFTVPENEVEYMKKLVTEEMENSYRLQIPLIVDVGIGDNWLQAH